MKKILTLALLSTVALSACSKVDSMFSSEDPPLPGERISVMELTRKLEPDDPKLSAEGLVTPAPWKNEFWPQAGGYPNHSMQNLEMPATALKKTWETGIGEGKTDELPLTAQPIAVEGKVFTLDTDSNLAAFDVASGKNIWSTNVRDTKEDDPVISGGISYAGGLIYVTAGYNELLAVTASNGKIAWRHRTPAPSRAAPTIIDGRVFVTTLDGRLLALSATDGAQLWEYAGISETATLVGGASPAANREIVVPAFSSGEVTALRVENGAAAWSDNLSGVRAIGGLESLAAIKALPVLDKGLAVAISYSGRIAAIDERTGNRVWQREIGGASTPWIAGNHLFVVTSDNHLIAMGRDSGVIRWVTKLPALEDERADWLGPILAGGRLLAFSADGRVAEADPVSGKIQRQWDTDSHISVAPIVAGGTLYILEDSGTLSAYR